MSTIYWVLVAVSVWLTFVTTLSVCFGDTKDADRAQSDLLAAARRARFVNPQPRRTQVGG
jgi:hypothetical protein